MESEKENWINEVLASHQGMERAIAPAALTTKIQNRIAMQNRLPIQFTRTQINWMVAATLLLVSFNGIAIYKHLQSKQAAFTNQATEYSFDTKDLLKL